MHGHPIHVLIWRYSFEGRPLIDMRRHRVLEQYAVNRRIG
jgi:hypothetical protein